MAARVVASSCDEPVQRAAALSGVAVPRAAAPGAARLAELRAGVAAAGAARSVEQRGGAVAARSAGVAALRVAVPDAAARSAGVAVPRAAAPDAVARSAGVAA